MDEVIKIFIGSGEASVIERKVLIHTLKKHTNRPLDIFVFNGTHDAVERNDEPPQRINMPLNIKYANVTEFSNYRWYIPQLCNYKGRAIWLDSDMIVFDDIGKLFDTPMENQDMLAVKGTYNEEEQQDTFATSVLLIDCEKCKKFDVELYYREIAEQKYTYNELMRMAKKFIDLHPYRLGALDPNWNVFDFYDERTKLLHYTDLHTQPWRYPNHPYGQTWFDAFFATVETGEISTYDIQKAIARGYVRPDILKGNSPVAKKQISKIATKDLLREVARRAKHKVFG